MALTEVFERAYAAVGLGWMYSFAKVPTLLSAANRVYDFWAKYRLQVTGRPSMVRRRPSSPSNSRHV